MSVSYTWIGWNRQKRLYDMVLVACIAVYLGVFYAVGRAAFPPPNDPTPELLLLRGLGTLGLLMLHVILWIGPLARLNTRFLPLLYNRRHLGVCTFLVGLAHAGIVLVLYHGFGNVNPLLSLLTGNTAYLSWSRFPFESLGLVALLILFLMAATSHDFWLKNLSPRGWKALHMGVYVAYGLLVMHVALGFLQQERHPAYVVLLGCGCAVTITLHLAAGIKEARMEGSTRAIRTPEPEFLDVASVDEIPNNRAKAVCLPGRDRIAVYRYDGKLSAVSNVCAHQGGPLVEGKIVGGCITCPWHGYQYLPGSGKSPPPFAEKIATYRVRVIGRRVILDPTPMPPGTPVDPAIINEP
jgi:sulfoxide reductase heme-binding subunit YedZ